MPHAEASLIKWSTHRNTDWEGKEPEMQKICPGKQNNGWDTNSKQAFSSEEQPDGQGAMSKGKTEVTASPFPTRSVFQCSNSVFIWHQSTVQSVHWVFDVSDDIFHFWKFYLVAFVSLFPIVLDFFMVSAFFSWFWFGLCP